MAKAKKKAFETVSTTRQQFKAFREGTVRGVNSEVPDDNEHERYWLCVGMNEGAKASKVLRKWADVIRAVFDRETA